MIASWISGAVVLVLLVALHWLAYRVGKSRARARRSRPAGRRGAATLANEPLQPE